MLTSDLLRARLRKDEVRPVYLDPGDKVALELAESLVGLYSAHVGRTRGALEGAMAELIGEGTDYLLHRGLAKLLSDRSTFEVDAPCDPIELRRRVFERASRHHPVALHEGDPVHPVSRAQVLAEVARELGIAPDAADRALYADLEDAHVLRAFDALAPAALLHRYNMALAQAVLFRATSLTITIAPGDPARYRQLFRFIKFYRLMASVRGDRGAGYTITLDGPASLFQLSSKYGLQMAEFLPALVLCEAWSLRAELLWGKERRPAHFKLEAGSGLVSHYPDKGVYVTDEEAWFVQRFDAHKSPWVLEKKPEIIDLGGHGVLIPDFVLRHRDDGREALLEIVGFWRKGYLESRLAVLKAHGPRSLILAVSRRLKGSEEELSEVPGEVFFFKDVILPREVIERAERVAQVNTARATEIADAGGTRKRKGRAAAAKPDSTKPAAADGPVAKTRVAKAGTARADVAMPEIAGAHVAKADMAMSDMAKAHVARADMAMPDMAKAHVAKARTAKADAAKADVTKADVTKADAAKADVTKADVTKADVTKADVTKADIARSDAARADVAAPAAPKRRERKPGAKASAP